MTTTDYIAIYGAFVATLVFVWDIAKWLTSGPSINATTKCHINYEDGRVIKTEIHDGVTTSVVATYCHIEISNVGDRATTILNIEGTHRASKKAVGILSCTAGRFTFHHGKRLPFVLGPGEVWSARFEMLDILNLATHGKPVISVQLSHLTKPLLLYPRDWSKYPVPGSDD